MRKRGTTVIIEDVAFPIEHLADAAVDLQGCSVKHGYDDAIIFGHAKDGNLHFVITQSFNDQAAVDQYARFIDDVVELVVKKYDGALKAEHGTGRNMAPFVETEWGPEAIGHHAAAEGAGATRRACSTPASSSTPTRRRTSRTSSRCPPSSPRRTSASSAASASRCAPAAS